VRYAVHHTDSVEPEVVAANAACALFKGTRHGEKRNKIQERLIDGTEEQLCNRCDTWKKFSLFEKRGECKDCKAIINRNRRETWRGSFQKLLISAKQNCNKRKSRGREGFDTMDLTLEDVVEMYVKQKGVCAYTGIPLTITGDWQMSLERMDVRVTYNKTNCCLVCLEMQSGDQRVKNKDMDVTTGCSWTKEKFNFVKANFAL
jgi:hypothetical protein